jgi:hypothetical protein
MQKRNLLKLSHECGGDKESGGGDEFKYDIIDTL